MYFPENPKLRYKRDRADRWRIAAEISGFVAVSVVAVGVWWLV